MQKKYVVCLEHDFIGLLYRRSDGYFTDHKNDAALYDREEASKLCFRFNYEASFSQHEFYFYEVFDGEVIDNA